ncbi:hypothetical protein [Rufibacter radiotolerans]|nr:hypothetical protein [Rufibacter radiotolerans]
MAALFLAAMVALYFLAGPLVEGFLKRQVVGQTEGLYHINFDDLHLHLRTRSMTLEGLHLYPDTATHRRQKENGQARRTLLEVQSQRVTLTRINLADLLFKNRLHINTLVAERPLITQLLDESVEEGRSLGSGSLKAVSIHKLALQKAKYRYLVLGRQSRPRHKIHQFSLKIQDLLLDLQQQESLTKMILAGALDLNLMDYTYQTPDSVYTFRIRSLAYSSGQQVLNASGVAALPHFHANRVLPENRRHRILYQVGIPLLSLKGLDLAVAFRTKRLLLDQLLLNRTALHIVEDTSTPDSAAFPGLSDMYASLSHYLREISVRELHLTSGSFGYSQKESAVHILHRLERADLHVQALQLDSGTLFMPKAKAFAEAVQLVSEHYTYTPPNSPYTLKAGRMQLSTRDKTLQAEKLHLAGDWDKNDRLKNRGKAKHTFYDIALPELHVSEFDLFKALQTSRLTIGRIRAVQPAIDVRTDQAVPKTEEGPFLRELYPQVSGLVSSLEVGEVMITNASLTHHSKTGDIQLLQQLEHASLAATGLLIDSAFIFNPEVTLPLQEGTVTALNYRYRVPYGNPTIALAGLRYSTRQQEFWANGVEVVSSQNANERHKSIDHGSRNIIDLSASALRVAGLDLIRALKTGHLEANILLLQNPEVVIQLDRTVAASQEGSQGKGKALFNLLDKVSVNTIQLEDGSFTLNEKLEPVLRTHYLEHVTATVSGFELTPSSFAHLQSVLPMQEMTLLAKDYTFQSTDNLYTIRLDSVHYSTRNQEIVAHAFSVSANREVNERLKAENPDLASRNLIDISSKRSRITGFNLIQAYATGQYQMEKLLLSSPKVTILQDHKVPLTANKTTTNQDTAAANGAMGQLNEMVTSLKVARLEVADGTFDFQILEDTIRESQTLEHVALAIDGLRLVSLEANDPLDIFAADDLGLLIQGYTYFTRDSLYALEVKEIKASMRNRSLMADSLRVRPLFSKEAYDTLFTYARNRVDAVVPEIIMQKISLRALFNNQDIIAEKMMIKNPVVEVYRDNRLGFNPELRPPTLQSALRDVELYIRVDTILVEKNNFLHPIIAIDGIKPAVFVLDSIQLQAYNVTNDTALIRINNIMTVNASALFMGASTLQVRFLFEMDHAKDRYTYQGTLEPMDFSALNPLLENMVYIRIKRGWINKASFSMEATGEEATGQVHFPYKNLKVQLLNRHNPDNPGFLLKAGSRLVNWLIIKSNNPSAFGKFRKGEVKVMLDPQRSVSYHISKSVQDGVTSSLMVKLVHRMVSKFVNL